MIHFFKKTILAFLFPSILAVLLSACRPTETDRKELETVKVQLGWIHQSQWGRIAEDFDEDKLADLLMNIAEQLS